MKTVVLKARRERSVRMRHPWIFSGAIDETASDRLIAIGETVSVVSASGETLGCGAYSPDSQIRVRMWGCDRKLVIDAAFIASRVKASVRRRIGLLSDGYTDAVRLVNAESDGLPGLVVDAYAGWVVCQFTAAAVEVWKGAIVAALMESVPDCRGVSERTDLKDRVKEGLSDSSTGRFRVLAGDEPPRLIAIREGSCAFYVDVREGHKTGFYLDQRDARRLVGSLAKGAEVLNCFCYTGGFGLFAKAGGAAKVTQVDISESAIALAGENERLTFGDASGIDYVQADVFQYLRTCRDARRKFDLIVLDPPKFAAVKSQVAKAARGYKDINLLAMKLLRPGGALVTFSCSGAMTPELFDKVLMEAAEDAGVDFQRVARTGPGADHPVALSFPEGAYLKGVVLRAIEGGV